MNELSEHQKDVKIAFLLRENQSLRESLLNLQISFGEIGFRDEEPQEEEPTASTEDEGFGDPTSSYGRS